MAIFGQTWSWPHLVLAKLGFWPNLGLARGGTTTTNKQQTNNKTTTLTIHANTNTNPRHNTTQQKWIGPIVDQPKLGWPKSATTHQGTKKWPKFYGETVVGPIHFLAKISVLVVSQSVRAPKGGGPSPSNCPSHRNEQHQYRECTQPLVAVWSILLPVPSGLPYKRSAPAPR